MNNSLNENKIFVEYINNSLKQNNYFVEYKNKLVDENSSFTECIQWSLRKKCPYLE